MLHVVIEKGKKSFIFSEILKKLKLFTETVIINFNDEHMYIQGMDASHITVFELKIYAKWFDTYVLTKEHSYQYGINTNIISKILSIRDENQHIRLVQYDENTDKLQIDFINKTPNEKLKTDDSDDSEITYAYYEKFFEIPLVDIDVDMLEIPPTDYDATLQIETKNFKNLIDNFAQFESTTIEFTFNQEDVILRTNGIETNMEVNIQHNQMEIYSISEDTNFTNSFPLKFIHNISQFSKISKLIQLQQSKGIPIEITYMIDDENLFRFYIAPTIQNYEDEEI